MTIDDYLLKKYETHPIRALLLLDPSGLGSITDEALLRRVESIRAKRKRVFFEQLAKSDELTDELIQSDDFLHCYFATLKCAMNTRRAEKIEMFATLLRSTAHDESLRQADEYEEYLQILDELSVREIQTLCLLETHCRIPRLPEQNELMFVSQFWDAFLQEMSTVLHTPKEECLSLLVRLARTGLFRPIETTGLWMEATSLEGRGLLTHLYYKFAKAVFDN